MNGSVAAFAKNAGSSVAAFAKNAGQALPRSWRTRLEKEQRRMGEPITVLVTGSAGRIGQAVVGELKRRGHKVHGFDRVPTPGTDAALVGDLTDPAAVQRAMAGAAALVHLAATPDD